MATLKSLFEALHENINLSTAEEIKKACELIIEVQSMSVAERDFIKAIFSYGPLDDGDVPSKSIRDTLLNSEYVAKIVVKGQDGYNACTHKGAWAYRLIKADAE